MENYATSIFVIIIAIIFIIEKNWFYLSASLILDFLIYTFMASRDHFRNDENNNDNKWLNILLRDKKKPLKAKIKRLGNEFIDIINEINEEITINKSDIISISKI